MGRRKRPSLVRFILRWRGACEGRWAAFFSGPSGSKSLDSVRRVAMLFCPFERCCVYATLPAAPSCLPFTAAPVIHPIHHPFVSRQALHHRGPYSVPPRPPRKWERVRAGVRASEAHAIRHGDAFQRHVVGVGRGIQPGPPSSRARSRSTNWRPPKNLSRAVRRRRPPVVLMRCKFPVLDGAPARRAGERRERSRTRPRGVHVRLAAVRRRRPAAAPRTQAARIDTAALRASSAASRASAKASKRRSSSVIRGASGCSANESLSSTRCRLASCANVDLAARRYSRYQKTCSRSEGVTTNSSDTSNANVRSINNRLYLRAQVPRYRACSLGSRSASAHRRRAAHLPRAGPNLITVPEAVVVIALGSPTRRPSRHAVHATTLGTRTRRPRGTDHAIRRASRNTSHDHTKHGGLLRPPSQRVADASAPKSS